MASPITWQNVTASNPTDVSRPMFYGQNAINLGFGAFADALKQYEAGQRDIWKRQDADATQAVLDQGYRAQSPEEFKQLLQSGALSAAVGPNGERIDRAAVNSFADARTGVLQGRQVDQFRFADAVRQNTDGPILGQATALLAQGDVEGARALGAQLSPQSKGLLASNIDKFERDRVLRSQADAAHILGLDKTGAEITRAEAETNAIAERERIAREKLLLDGRKVDNDLAQTDIQRTQAETAARTSRISAAERLGRLADESAAKVAATEKGIIGTDSGMKSLLSNLKTSIGDDAGTLQSLSGILGAALRSNPDFRSLPTDVVEAIALKHAEDAKTGFLTKARGVVIRNVTEDFKTALTQNADRISAAAASRENLINLNQQHRLSYDQAQRDAFPELAKRLEDAAKRAPYDGDDGAPSSGVRIPGPSKEFPDGGNQFKNGDGISRDPRDSWQSGVPLDGFPGANGQGARPNAQASATTPGRASPTKSNGEVNIERVPAAKDQPAFYRRTDAKDTLNTPEMARRAVIERQLISIGRLNKYSPEVNEFLSAQGEAQRAISRDARQKFAARVESAVRERPASMPNTLYYIQKRGAEVGSAGVADLEKELKRLAQK